MLQICDKKCPPHLNNVLMLPSENETSQIHSSYLYNALNDRPDGIIHQTEVW